MIEIENQYTCTEHVSAAPDEVYRLLADVRDSASHFPDVDSLELGEDGCWTWKLKKAQVGRVSVQMVYGCSYELDAEARTVRWVPVDGVGNGCVSGHWSVEPAGAGSRFTIANGLVLRLGLSRLALPIARPIVRRENTRMISTYMENLVKTFSGSNGRLR